MTETIHKFEERGLGLAPFTDAGFEEIVYKSADGTTKAGGTCDYCGTAIRNAFWLRSKDGKRFKVGCECIRKSGDEGLIKWVSDEEKARRQEKANAKYYAELAKRQAAQEAQDQMERERNGGLTDHELAIQKREAELVSIRTENAAIIETISNEGSSYAAGWVRTLETTRIAEMSERAKGYLFDLYAKQFGRRNSKAYNDAYDEISGEK